MKLSSKTARLVLMFATLGMLMQSIGAEASDIKVTLTVPSFVNAGQTFQVGVNVINKSSTTTLTFNKVAAGYVLPDLKVKGPYEVSTVQRTVNPGSSASFVFPFVINYARGSIIPLSVIIAKDSYSPNGIIEGSMVGVNVSNQ